MERESPEVSVVIPTFDRAHLLARAINSVLAQSVHDWEMILVDDGSTDHTAAIVANLTDCRIRYVRHQANCGGAAARNTGMREARGNYLAFLDSDDEWLPEKLEKQLKRFRTGSPSLGLVYCASTLVTAEGEQPGHEARLEGWIYERLLDLDVGCTASSFMVTRKVRESGFVFDETLPSWQDWDFLVQVSRHFQVAACPERLVITHRDHGGPHVWEGTARSKGTLLVLEKYAFDLTARAVARQHRRLARDSYLAGDSEGMRVHLWRAFRATPGDLRMWGWLAAGLIPDPLFRMLVSASWSLSDRLVGSGIFRRHPRPFRT
jgi:glycosyltransferase involved in cell wall biosynthesis